MNREERIRAFVKVGEQLKDLLAGKETSSTTARLLPLIESSVYRNGWFTPGNIRFMLAAIADGLSEKNLRTWLEVYAPEVASPRNVAVIMAGNIPMVGFHDFLSVLISGHRFTGKCSSDDSALLPVIAAMLTEAEPRFAGSIHFVNGKLEGMDAVIATGSNNSARYFDYYFSKYPHIIRRNRHAVAVLDGSETSDELALLGNDVFRYFGLGCRNVSKLFVPAGYDFDRFYKALLPWGDEMNMSKKYMNNYEYHRTLYLLNQTPLLDNNFLLLKEDEGLSSPVGVLYYEYWNSREELNERLRLIRENLQCITGKGDEWIPFGQCQQPSNSDYADHVDTMKFLLEL